MTQRAWIRVIPEGEATGLLRDLYEQEWDDVAGGVDNILAVHSLNPATLRAHADLYHTVMHASGPLTRMEREMIAVVVSAHNGCQY